MEVEVGEIEDGVEGAVEGASDEGLNIAPGAGGGRGIRRCLGIDAG